MQALPSLAAPRLAVRPHIAHVAVAAASVESPEAVAHLRFQRGSALKVRYWTDGCEDAAFCETSVLSVEGLDVPKSVVLASNLPLLVCSIRPFILSCVFLFRLARGWSSQSSYALRTCINCLLPSPNFVNYFPTDAFVFPALPCCFIPLS